jgi:hypothetical protein
MARADERSDSLVKLGVRREHAAPSGFEPAPLPKINIAKTNSGDSCAYFFVDHKFIDVFKTLNRILFQMITPQARARPVARDQIGLTSTRQPNSAERDLRSGDAQGRRFSCRLARHLYKAQLNFRQKKLHALFHR